MRTYLSLFCSVAILLFTSCGGKNSKPGDKVEADSLTTTPLDSISVVNKETKKDMAAIQPFIEKELNKWAQSFSGFTLDSFRLTQKTNMEQTDYQLASDLKIFYDLYKPSLIFSPDSSQFIDLFSSGISLERKGKKIIAMGDVDQAITIKNIKTNEWKQVAFFGPSAGMEEAVWLSDTQFLLAGIFENNDGKAVPVLLLGDLNNKSFHWYEANITRGADIEFKSSRLESLKIDEWE